MNHLYQAPNDPLEDANCFGGYQKGNPICFRHCLLRLRCAIEQHQNLQTELFEELVGADNELGKVQ